MSEQSSSSKTLSPVQKTPEKSTGYSVPKPNPNLDAENQDETVLMAMNIYAEARGESDEGKSAVGQVVYNRVHGTKSNGKHVTWWGSDIKGVICQKYQFSWLNNRNSREYKNAVAADEASWETCYRYAQMTLAGGGIANLTKNGKISDGYCNLSQCSPDWATADAKIAKIGSHTFFTTENLVGLDGAKPADQAQQQTQAQAAPQQTQTQTQAAPQQTQTQAAPQQTQANNARPNASGGSTQKPAAAETVHIVKRGDTLSGIAAIYHVSGGYPALARYNGISNPNLINVGQKIRIPGTASSSTAANSASENKVSTSASSNEVGKKEEKKEEKKQTASKPSVSSGKKGYVVNISSTDFVNVRETPDTSKDPVGRAGLNKVVTILGKVNDWYQVDTGVCQGYMHSNYIREGEHSVVSESQLNAAINFANGKIGSKSYKNYETGMTYCQGFVADCAAKALGTRYCTASAMDARNNWKESTDQSNIPLGAAIYMNSNTKNGRIYGHVGFYVGNGEMCHVWGPVAKCKVSDINTATNGLCSFNSWGWNGGIPLSDKYE